MSHSYYLLLCCGWVVSLQPLLHATQNYSLSLYDSFLRCFPFSSHFPSNYLPPQVFKTQPKSDIALAQQPQAQHLQYLKFVLYSTQFPTSSKPSKPAYSNSEFSSQWHQLPDNYAVTQSWVDNAVSTPPSATHLQNLCQYSSQLWRMKYYLPFDRLLVIDVRPFIVIGIFIKILMKVVIFLVVMLGLGWAVDYQGAFSHIYSNKVWNGDGPLSGPGSNPCTGLQYLIFLQHFLSRSEIHKVVEVGFGDWEMMQHILLQGKKYVGFEVVKSILRKSQYNTAYKIISGLREIQESGDLLIARDVMQHWPSQQIDYFVKNILPRFKYALLTNDYSREYANAPPGGYRPISLQKYDNMQKVLQIDFKTGHSPKVTMLYTNPHPQ